MLDRPPCGAAIYRIAGLLQFRYERMAKRVLAHKVYGCWVYGADFGIIAFGNQKHIVGIRRWVNYGVRQVGNGTEPVIGGPALRRRPFGRGVVGEV